MLTRDDLIDLLVAGLAKAEPAAAVSPPRAAAGAGSARTAGSFPGGPKGRLFLSERDIKKRLTAGGKRLTIPQNSMLSPLASDWLVLLGIEIVRE